MPKPTSEYRVFFQQFLRNFQSTGALTPSGRFLAATLTRYVPGAEAPRRILEVGPGTGAVTRQIVARMGPQDHFDLVELNSAFVTHLRRRFASEPGFVRVADRTRVIHQRVEELPLVPTYDLIISGLPLNNFAAADVRSVLSAFTKLLQPGGTLSFFEYVAVRPTRTLVSGGKDRHRLREIGHALKEVLSKHEIRRDWVLPNVPPAWVHHVRFDAPKSNGVAHSLR